MTVSGNQNERSNLPIQAALAFSQIYQLAYAQIAPDLTITQTSPNFRSILFDIETALEGQPLTQALVEFIGNESAMELVLNGTMPSFLLELVRRDQSDGTQRFLTFYVLPLDEFHPGKGLLCLVEDASRLGQIKQQWIQKHNEARLMQEALTRAYAELERLANSDRESAECALQIAHFKLQESYDRTMEGWVRALDLRDREIEGHTLRVAEMTVRLARTAGIPESEIVHIRRGALLHDIGKMGLPDSILHKEGELSESEWAAMKKHPVYAYEMLTAIPYLRPALDIPYCHHEKWDGSGYPRGLSGEQIPLAARLFAVVDVWDALLSNRSYRQGWNDAQTLDYIRANAGTHFDPQAVSAFTRMIEELAHSPEIIYELFTTG